MIKAGCTSLGGRLFELITTKKMFMKSTVLLLLIFAYLGNSCTSNNTMGETAIKSTPLQTGSDKNLHDTSQVPEKYLRLFPNTSRSFSNLSELSTYVIAIKKDFLSASGVNGQGMEFDISDTAVYVKREFDRAMNVLFLTHAKKWKNTPDGIFLLGMHPDISTKEKLNLFETFPKEIKESTAGKNTFSLLTRYVYEKNIGVDFKKFSDAYVFQKNGKKNPLQSILTHSKQYTLVIFGASWCRPCLIQERRLKEMYSSIDTSSLQVAGIYIDGTMPTFKKYVEREAWPWNSYWIEKEAENPVFKVLGEKGVPMNLLIDSSGKIVKYGLNVFEVLEFIGIKIPII